MSIYSVVTLKIRSRSLKSNHFFALSLCCICASSIKFQPLVKEILCTQTFYSINKGPLGSFLFVCVEVLRPSQPNGIMSNAVYWAGLVLYVVNQYCAHSFARNWQLSFLHQRKGESDHRKYFMINLHERMLPTLAGVEPATSWSPVGRRIKLSHRCRRLLFDFRIYNVMTLKIRSKSPKSNQFFPPPPPPPHTHTPPPSWWCSCASLVKFQTFVRDSVHTNFFLPFFLH